MLYAVLFEDNESHAAMRARHMEAHLAFLAERKDRVRAAGPLAEGQSGTPAGGLWLVEAESPAAVEALIAEDPFWPTGLRKSQRILAWRQVFAAGQRLI